MSPDNIRATFAALRTADYHPAVPIVAEQFADPAMRENWRAEKGMLVLKFWSDLHRATPLDVFITEPFPFEEEFREAPREELAPGLTVPYVRLETLLAMKRAAGRRHDLTDIDELNLLQGRPSPYDDPPN